MDPHFQQRVADFMRSSRAIQVRWLQSDEDVTSTTRKILVEEYPCMYIPSEKCTYDIMKQCDDYAGFRACPRCDDPCVFNHTKMRIDGGVDERTRYKVGVEIHVCKICGYLTWFAFDEATDDEKIPKLDDFEGPGCFDFRR